MSSSPVIEVGTTEAAVLDPKNDVESGEAGKQKILTVNLTHASVLSDRPSNTARDAGEKAVVLSFRALQLERIEALQDELVRHDTDKRRVLFGTYLEEMFHKRPRDGRTSDSRGEEDGLMEESTVDEDSQVNERINAEIDELLHKYGESPKYPKKPSFLINF
jgi:hypothetical protein